MVGSKKRSGKMLTVNGLISAMFQNNVKRVLRQNKAHTKIS